MKKLMKTATLLLLTLALALSTAACASAYNKVEKALTGIGYSVIENDDKADDMKGESEVAVTVHVLSNKDSLKATEIAKINVVIVFEFKATEDMIEFYKDSDTMQGFVKDVKDDGTAEEFYNALVEKGFAKGNCMVMSINPIAAGDVMEAVKNA